MPLENNSILVMYRYAIGNYSILVMYRYAIGK